jgi:3-phosphoinositide dependent protein kinase-1
MTKSRRKFIILKESDKKAIISKQNFVGTAEFMAPEVITNKEIGIFTDLWSFGCILFQLFMGNSPFRDKTEYLTFQNILNLNYKIDHNIVPEDARDLIENLLKLDPKERIGSGLKPDNGLERLKNHKFFKNFDTKKYLDIIEENLKKTYNISRDTSSSASMQEISKSDRILKNEKEKIVKMGELKKKSPWLFYDKRKIILYNTGRVDYFDPKTNILKGSITLTKECRAEFINKTSFNLITSNRTYYFLCKSKFDITPWVTEINEVIKNIGVN